MRLKLVVGIALVIFMFSVGAILSFGLMASKTTTIDSTQSRDNLLTDTTKKTTQGTITDLTMTQNTTEPNTTKKPSTTTTTPTTPTPAPTPVSTPVRKTRAS
jgi:hypothetical protein